MSREKRFTILVVAAGLLVMAGSIPIIFQQILAQWYLWKLESTDEEARRTAAEKLGQLRSTRAVQPRARILRQEAGKPPPLHYSAKALAEIGFAAVPALVQALEDPDRNDSDYAAGEALLQIGSPAIPELLEAHRDPSSRVYNAASGILARMGPLAEPHLQDTLRNGSVEAVRFAIEAFEHMDTASRASIEALLTQLDGDMPQIRSDAAWALGKIGGFHRGEILPALLNSTKDESAAVRWAALIALGKIGPDARAVRALISSLEDSDRRVQIAATYPLKQIGPEALEAVPALEKLLADCSFDDLVQIAEALIAIGAGEKAVPSLVRFTVDPDSSIRQFVAWTLGRIGPKPDAVLPALIRLIEDADWRVQRGALQALGDIGPGAKEAVSAVARALEHPHREVRSDGAMTLGMIGPAASEAIPALIRALDDPDKSVVGSVETALKKIRGN